MTGMTCACCGSDITAPKFKDGKAYGWACYGKLFGDKGKKPNRMISIDFIRLIDFGLVVENFDSVKGGILVFKFNDKQFDVPVILNQERANAYRQGSAWYVSLLSLQKKYPKVNFE